MRAVAAGGGGELDEGGAGVVDDGDDGADVVPVGGVDPCPGGEELAVGAGPGEAQRGVGGVGVAVGDELGGEVADVDVAVPQPVEAVLVGDPGDGRQERVVEAGERLGAGLDDGLADVEVEFVGVFGGERDAVGVGSFDEFGGLGGGGVEVAAVAGAGHGDVDGFAVEAGGADEEHAVAGDALGLVDGGGVAVVDVAGVRRSRRRAQIGVPLTSLRSMRPSRRMRQMVPIIPLSTRVGRR